MLNNSALLGYDISVRGSSLIETELNLEDTHFENTNINNSFGEMINLSSHNLQAYKNNINIANGSFENSNLTECSIRVTEFTVLADVVAF